jgi:release factor glutamine methyltransferase
VDVSAAALAVARGNANAAGLPPGRVRLLAGDLIETLAPASMDVVVANLPYLPSEVLSSLAPEVTDHEPRIALDGGPDGLRWIERLVADARRVLRPGGLVALETAGGAQARTIAGRMSAMGYRRVSVRADLAGVERFVAANVPDSTQGVA